MSDARRYAVWPDPRSRSWALESWKSVHFQKLSLPFTMAAGSWPQILKLGHNIKIWSGQIFDISPSLCIMWLWTWHKRQLWRVDCQSRTGLIYVVYAVIVCLSVRTAKSGIMQTMAYDTRASSLLKQKTSVKFHRGHPQQAPNRGGVGYSWQFSTNISPYLRNGAR